MKKSMKAFIACSTLALVCAAGGTALAIGNVTAKAETPVFAMEDGAAIRIKGDNNGIRFTAALDVSSEEELVTAYGADSSFYMMIIPKVYYTTYLTESTDYYKDLNTALTEGKINYIASMEATPFVATAADEQLVEGDYYIQGSLTNLQYDNLNSQFIGIAYYQYDVTTGEGDEAMTETKRVYTDVNLENARSIVNVASRVLNAGVYKDGSTQDTVVDTYIRQGINKALGNSADHKDDAVDSILESVMLSATEAKVLDKAETALTVENLPAKLDAEVEWSTAANQTVLGEVTDGTIKPLTYGETTVTAKVLGTTYTCAVKSYKADDWTFDNDESNDKYYDLNLLKQVGNNIIENKGTETGALQLTIGHGWYSVFFTNGEMIKAAGLQAGDAVTVGFKMKILQSDGTELTDWSSLSVYVNGYTQTATLESLVTGTTPEGKIVTYSTLVNDYYCTQLHAVTNPVTTDLNVAIAFAGGWGAGDKNYTVVIEAMVLEKNFKADDWTFDIGVNDIPADVKTTVKGNHGALTLGLVNDNGVGALSTTPTAGYLSACFVNENMLKNYTAGDYVLMTIKIKVLSAEGTALALGTSDTSTMTFYVCEKNAAKFAIKTMNNYVVGEVDANGYYTVTYPTKVNAGWMKAISENTNWETPDGEGKNIALAMGGGWKSKTILIDSVSVAPNA